jgi:carboxylesterase
MATTSTTDRQAVVGIVLIHGLTGTPVEMKPLEKYLRRMGFDVENVLLSGHAGSHKDILAAKWEQWVDNVRGGVEKILERNDRVIVCGLSMGAILAAVIASENEKVCGAVLMSPTWSYDGSVMLNKAFDALVKFPVVQNSVRSLVGWFPILGEKIFWEETPPYGLRDERLQRQITRSIEEAKKGGSNEFGTFRTYYGPLWQMWALVDHARRLLNKVTCPVMIVSSLEDTLASINNAMITYLGIASSHKGLFMLTGCDHVMTLDLQKQQLYKMIGSFVTEFGAGTAQKTIMDVISPTLQREKADTRGGALTITMSQGSLGLSASEWHRLYADRPFTTTMRNAGAKEVHSLVARNNGEAFLHIPISLTEERLYVQNFAPMSNLVAPEEKRVPVLSMGSENGGTPPIGVGVHSDYALYVKAWSYSIELFQACAKNRKTDWVAYHGLSRKVVVQMRAKKSTSGKLAQFQPHFTTPLYESRFPVLNKALHLTGGRITGTVPQLSTEGGASLPEDMLSAT